MKLQKKLFCLISLILLVSATLEEEPVEKNNCEEGLCYRC
jgi:hypothetical protein